MALYTGYSNIAYPKAGPVWNQPALGITTATATSESTPSPDAREAHVQIVFGTVAGVYGTPTAQLQTTFNGGTTWFNVGSAVALTATSAAVNLFSVFAQAPSSSAVTTSTASSSAALAFGQQVRVVFAAASYGTSAPATVSILIK